MQSLGKKPIVSLIGKSFGMLLVVGEAPRKQGIPTWECKCSCGETLPVTGKDLKSGHTQSCGHDRQRNIVAASTKHGACRKGQYTAEYWIHATMLARCYNPQNEDWKYYGGRGIKVCERWRSMRGFENFLSDVGYRPTKHHSIDRINNDGNYEPANVRWATKKEQANNRRKTT